MKKINTKRIWNIIQSTVGLVYTFISFGFFGFMCVISYECGFNNSIANLGIVFMLITTVLWIEDTENYLQKIN